MGVTPLAPDLGADHAQRPVLDQLHGVAARWLVEARPAAVGLEFLRRAEQLRTAGTAPVHAFGLGVGVLTCPWRLGPRLPEYLVLIRGKQIAPLRLGSLDLVHVAETTSPDTDTVETSDTAEGPMEWLNEPASWQRTGDVLTVSVDPGTDFWRETGYGYIRDSGHVYGEVLAGDLDVSVRLRCTLGVQYDQAGVMLRADERTWLKTGVEFFEGRARLSTVLTLGRSSWMVTDLPAGTDDVALRVSRRGDAVEVRYQVSDGPAELAALVFLPPGREVLAGVMAAAPEGPGFRVTFQDLRITERDWSGPAGKDTAWQDDQAEWAAEEASGWSPVDGGPGWMAPVAGEDDPDWPATVAGTQSPGWPAPDEDLGWAAPAGGEEDPGWPARAGGEEDPGWPAAGMGDDEPGWAAAAVATAGPESAALDEAALDGPTLDGLGQEEPAQDDSGQDDSGQDDSGWPGAADAGAADGGDSDAGDSEAEPAVAEHGGPQPVKARSAGDEHAVDEPAAPET